MEHYEGLARLEQELHTAATNKALTDARRECALGCLEFIAEARNPEYKFENDDYFPDGEGIDQLPLHEIKVCCYAGHRWFNDPSRPRESWETVMVTVPLVSPSVPTDLLPVSTDIPAEFGHEQNTNATPDF